jgi:nucleotide-binding universal stress UspA family protein
MGTVLCAVDFSEVSLAAAVAGAALARRLSADLVLLHVRPDTGEDRLLADASTPVFARGLATRAHEIAQVEVEADRERLRGIARGLGSGLAQVRVEIGDPASRILEVADELAASLIVSGTHGRRAAARWFLGSVAETLVRTSSRPVLVVRDPERVKSWDAPLRTLTLAVAVDESDATGDALRFSGELARNAPGRLVCLNAYWPPAEAARNESSLPDDPADVARLERALEARLRAQIPGLPSGRLVAQPSWGRAPDALALRAESEGADVLVVGTRSRAGGRGLFALRAVRVAEMPVLCVPPSREATAARRAS